MKSSKETGKNKKDAINKLKLLIQDSKRSRQSENILDYLNDLLKVLKDLDSLPPYLIKKIKKLKISKDGDHANSIYQELQNEIKPYYLKSRIYNSQKINNKTEEIILKEELNDV